MRALAIALFAIGGAACYPSFEFDETSQGGAPGGSKSSARAGPGPGATTGPGDPASTSVSTGPGATTSGTTVTSSTSSGSMDPQVPCGPENGGVLVDCAPGEVCCFHMLDPALDTCQSGGCGAEFATIGCNGPEDCPSGLCCGDFDDFLGDLYLVGIACATSCAGPDDFVMCNTSADCGGGTCSAVILDAGYDLEYKGCN
jgi:hypothetical protein